MPPTLLERYQGCLLAGAVGDALGAPLEFLSIEEIAERFPPTRSDPFGPLGVRTYHVVSGQPGAITDDTQMTLFTAEGLLRVHNRQLRNQLGQVQRAVHRAYLRWLETQRQHEPPPRPDGWLASLSELYQRREPSNSCLAALRMGIMGSKAAPINNSKDAAGIVRIAPVALAPRWDPWDLGCDVAAVTHTHPLGYLTAGAFALMLSRLLKGDTLTSSADVVLARLRRETGAKPLVILLERAMYLAEIGDPSPEQLATLGAGWSADEALAMGVYCAASVDSLEDGVALAVLHSGNSASTGSIAGSLLGAQFGVADIPEQLLQALEFADLIRDVADDLYLHFQTPDFLPDEADWQRYPG